MSIATTISGLERTTAVHTTANTVPVAKRGMSAMIERRRCYSSLLHGAYSGYVGFTPCIVTSVDRAGVVKEVKLAGQSWPVKRRDWQEITVDSAGKVANPSGVCAALVDDRGFAIEYRDKEEAIRAIKAAAGLSQ
jgi:hypothetical protein